MYGGLYHSYVVQVVVCHRIMKIYKENHDKIIAILLKKVAVSFKYFEYFKCLNTYTWWPLRILFLRSHHI